MPTSYHPEQSPATAPPGRTGSYGYILYAEDNLTDAAFFIRALSQHAPRTRCTHLENGSVVQHHLQRCLQQGHELPQLVVVDIKMPGLSGLDLLAYIRRTEGLHRLPVIVLSASAEARDLNRAYDYSVNAYLVKPNRYRHLNELVGMMVTFWIHNNRPPA